MVKFIHTNNPTSLGSILVSFLITDQMLDINSLKREIIYFAHSFRGFVHYCGKDVVEQSY
jgi:hypothetical protein